MRVLIPGELVAVRFVNTKDGMTAYFDILQHASKSFAAQVVNVITSDIKTAKTIQTKLTNLVAVKTIMLCNLVQAPKELIFNFVELIDLEGVDASAD